jgi:hypothetical protein
MTEDLAKKRELLEADIDRLSTELAWKQWALDVVNRELARPYRETIDKIISGGGVKNGRAKH